MNRLPILAGLCALVAAGLLVVLLKGSPGGAAADAIADDYDAQGCSSVRREAPLASELPPEQRFAQTQAEQSLVLTCVAETPGPEVVLYRFEEPAAARVVGHRFEEAGVRFCLAEDVIITSGRADIRADATRACELVAGAWQS